VSADEWKPTGSEVLPPTHQSLQAVRPSTPAPEAEVEASDARAPTLGSPRVARPAEALGPYELLKLLGEGSMGQVFLGRHKALGRQVAIKVLRPELARQDEQVARFFQEARAVNQVNHRNIVQIIDFVREPPSIPGQPDTVYFVMELLPGKSLSDWFRDGGFGIAHLVDVIVQVCAALQAAHGAGVVHRDIKPDNVIVEERDGRFHAKVVDFGVAKLLVEQDRVAASTSHGATIGTPLYMSPEQAAAEPVDHRADIYALGSVIYEGLSGHPPFQSSSIGGLFAQVIRDRPPPLPATTHWGEVIPAALAEVVDACLGKEREARPQSMAALAELLQAALVAPAPHPATSPAASVVAEAAPTPASGLEPELVAPARPWGPLVVAGLVGSFGLGTVGWWILRPPPPAPVVVHVTTTPIDAAPPPPLPPAVPVAVPAPAPTPPAAAAVPESPEAARPEAAKEATPGRGELAVVAVRSGRPFFATVFVDGMRLGNSPLQRPLAAGRHHIHLARDGVPSEDRDVVVRAGATTQLRVEMAP
jgi:tRNA A-37 threonylcarbamoyl transferase component Bud32